MPTSKKSSPPSNPPPDTPPDLKSQASDKPSLEKSKPKGYVSKKQIPQLVTLSKARSVREGLLDKAQEIMDLYLNTIVEAREAGEYEQALKGLQFILEHMPADKTTGERVLDHSVDKQPKEDGRRNRGPSIKIGIAVAPGPKQLGPTTEVVDAEVKDVT